MNITDAQGKKWTVSYDSFGNETGRVPVGGSSLHINTDAADAASAQFGAASGAPTDGSRTGAQKLGSTPIKEPLRTSANGVGGVSESDPRSIEEKRRDISGFRSSNFINTGGDVADARFSKMSEGLNIGAYNPPSGEGVTALDIANYKVEYQQAALKASAAQTQRVVKGAGAEVEQLKGANTETTARARGAALGPNATIAGVKAPGGGTAAKIDIQQPTTEEKITEFNQNKATAAAQKEAMLHERTQAGKYRRRADTFPEGSRERAYYNKLAVDSAREMDQKEKNKVNAEEQATIAKQIKALYGDDVPDGVTVDRDPDTGRLILRNEDIEKDPLLRLKAKLEDQRKIAMEDYNEDYNKARDIIMANEPDPTNPSAQTNRQLADLERKRNKFVTRMDKKIDDQMEEGLLSEEAREDTILANAAKANTPEALQARDLLKEKVDGVNAILDANPQMTTTEALKQYNDIGTANGDKQLLTNATVAAMGMLQGGDTTGIGARVLAMDGVDTRADVQKVLEGATNKQLAQDIMDDFDREIGVDEQYIQAGHDAENKGDRRSKLRQGTMGFSSAGLLMDEMYADGDFEKGIRDIEKALPNTDDPETRALLQTNKLLFESKLDKDDDDEFDVVAESRKVMDTVPLDIQSEIEDLVTAKTIGERAGQRMRIANIWKTTRDMGIVRRKIQKGNFDAYNYDLYDNLLSRLPSGKESDDINRRAIAQEMDEFIGDGNHKRAIDFYIDKFAESRPTATERADIQTAKKSVAEMFSLKQAIDDYEDLGGKFGKISGNFEQGILNFTGFSTDEKFVETKTRIEVAMFNFLKATQGSRPSDKDLERYTELFPEKGQSFSVGKGKMDGLIKQLEVGYESTLGSLLGEDYQEAKALLQYLNSGTTKEHKEALQKQYPRLIEQFTKQRTIHTDGILSAIPRQRNTGNIANDLNNPGNLTSGGLGDAMALGFTSITPTDGNSRNFLVFSSPTEGIKAMEADIAAKQSGGSTYLKGTETLNEFIDVYAGKPTSQGYRDTVAKIAGVSLSDGFKGIDTTLLARAVRTAEGFTGGEPISFSPTFTPTTATENITAGANPMEGAFDGQAKSTTPGLLNTPDILSENGITVTRDGEGAEEEGDESLSFNDFLPHERFIEIAKGQKEAFEKGKDDAATFLNKEINRVEAELGPNPSKSAMVLGATKLVIPFLGEAAGVGLKTAWGGIKNILPKATQNVVADVTEDIISNVLGEGTKEMLSGMMENYGEWSEEHPDLALQVNGAVKIIEAATVGELAAIKKGALPKIRGKGRAIKEVAAIPGELKPGTLAAVEGEAGLGRQISAGFTDTKEGATQFVESTIKQNPALAKDFRGYVEQSRTIQKLGPAEAGRPSATRSLSDEIATLHGEGTDSIIGLKEKIKMTGSNISEMRRSFKDKAITQNPKLLKTIDNDIVQYMDDLGYEVKLSTANTRLLELQGKSKMTAAEFNEFNELSKGIDFTDGATVTTKSDKIQGAARVQKEVTKTLNDIQKLRDNPTTDNVLNLIDSIQDSQQFARFSTGATPLQAEHMEIISKLREMLPNKLKAKQLEYSELKQINEAYNSITGKGVNVEAVVPALTGDTATASAYRALLKKHMGKDYYNEANLVKIAEDAFVDKGGLTAYGNAITQIGHGVSTSAVWGPQAAIAGGARGLFAILGDVLSAAGIKGAKKGELLLKIGEKAAK